ncbi:hypothetical protein SAMN05421595_2794 [Austwickia chelonae]|uniref:Glycosyltransferase RgtA/B/C/D-like domain-containing protein n=1 Tax=Austwickia chelonae NBRC 105200 TaxID=1184607 RepID=K6UMY2_9MICO|nr:hypothetical protein [Austwickia chelonae]GAB78521.1 hypothetical protein AUCHE_09_01260 [Austwickia chelonae NBRC 105200]SEW40362.1 hypothetical protein SAMN05421595_2794 [Austwickia chelonae]
MNRTQSLRLLWCVVALIALGGAVARLTGLDIQNYWIDEIFSVRQTDSSLIKVLRVGRTEVHPPTYALLLHVWVLLGGNTTAWTHLLSALISIGGIAVSYLALRRSTLPDVARALIVIATACSGFSLAYAQETRAYSLIWLAAVGTTATTLLIVEQLAAAKALAKTAEATPAAEKTEATPAAEKTPATDQASAVTDPAVESTDPAKADRKMWIAWIVWGLLGSAGHMFGAILVIGAAATLLLMFHTSWKKILIATGIAILPQVSWVGLGMAITPKFANGAKWAPAPDGESVVQLFLNTFSWGPLTQVEDGFYFHGMTGVAIFGGILVLALLARAAMIVTSGGALNAPANPDAEPTTEDSLNYVVIALGILTTGTIIAVYGVSQIEHLWLLRNMIVIAPALSWLVCLLVVLLAPRGAIRMVFASAVTVALVASMFSATGAQRVPYKTGFRDAVYDIMRFRQAHPDGFVQHNVDSWWLLGTDHPRDDASLNKILLPGQRISPGPFPKNIVRTDRPTLVVGMRLHLRDNEKKGRYIMDSLGADRCRQIMHKDVTVIWCDAPTAANPNPTAKPAPDWPRP